MVERYKIEKPKRGNPNMVKGHQISVGNKGTQVKMQNRYFARALADELGIKPGVVEVNYKNLRKIARKMVKQAYGGNERVQEHIADRIDGKVIQGVTMQDENGEPYEFTIKIGHASPDGSKTATEVRIGSKLNGKGE